MIEVVVLVKLELTLSICIVDSNGREKTQSYDLALEMHAVSSQTWSLDHQQWSFISVQTHRMFCSYEQQLNPH